MAQVCTHDPTELHEALARALGLDPDAPYDQVARALGVDRQHYRRVRTGERGSTDLIAAWCARASERNALALEVRVLDRRRSFVFVDRDTP